MIFFFFIKKNLFVVAYIIHLHRKVYGSIFRSPTDILMSSLFMRDKNIFGSTKNTKHVTRSIRDINFIA